MSYELDVPEGMLGTLMAIEGMKDAATIMHGPTGCKYYPSSCSESGYPDRYDDGPRSCDPFRYMKRFYFIQPRIPCTYMDGEDYVMGAAGKLEELTALAAADGPGLIGIVNSPGASLIGEEPRPVRDIPTAIVRSPRMSAPMCEGFCDGVNAVLRAADPVRHPEKGTVNILGISIWHLNWQDDLSDLRALLGACGAKVIADVGAGWSLEEARRSADAQLNVLAFDEFGESTAAWYENAYGIPCARSGMGAPIGFDSLERWVECACLPLGIDPRPALDMIAEKRHRVASVLAELESQRRLPRGRTFSVEAGGSMTYAIVRFLYEYLGMIPVAIDTGLDDSYDAPIGAFLEEKGLNASDDVFCMPTDVVIGSGNLVASMMQRGLALGGVDISRPSREDIRIDPRPVIGLGGTVRLLEGVLNAL